MSSVQPLIECVPNFSEGRDASVIERIAASIEGVDGVNLLNVDPGRATNRTVFTFVGAPNAVCEAAFQAAKTGTELIDMRKHRGEHPRMGALDVCPLIPVAGITMEETAALARALGKRLGEELGLTVYLYENAATSEARRNLADIRSGEYEALEAKLGTPEWKPDFGPTQFDPRRGASAVGARDFLVAYNVNLNTTSTRRANAIAFDIREKGRQKLTADGKPMMDEKGEAVWQPGSLKSVKAIGWFIEEYGTAQISMNLTNIGVTPVHIAFDEACRAAERRGIRVTGSELVGLIPLKAMLDAGRYFLRKQQRSTGVSDRELIKIAVKSLGLDELGPFDPFRRIIEYAIQVSSNPLIKMPLGEFIEETASESAAPGGGSVAAAMGALGAALGTMVANLSAHKKGWDERWEEFSDWAEIGKRIHNELQRMVDEDTEAFNAIMTAFALPKGSEEERAVRANAIQDATKGAILVPLRVMELSCTSFRLLKAMTEVGNPNSVSDAGVGVLATRAAIRSAGLNVRINCSGLKDRAFAEDAIRRAESFEQEAERAESEILSIVSLKT